MGNVLLWKKQKDMTAFRILLILLFINIVAFTITASNATGWNLVSVFINDIKAMSWNGQFNVDFSSYLALSALWIAWRHRFSGPGIAMALVALVMGIMVFAPYVLIASMKAKGDVRQLVLGEQAGTTEA